MAQEDMDATLYEAYIASEEPEEDKRANPDMCLPETCEENGGNGGTFDIWPNETLEIRIGPRCGGAGSTSHVSVKIGYGDRVPTTVVEPWNIVRRKLQEFVTKLVGELRFVEGEDSDASP